jgi:hypothetical protein
MTDHRDRYEGNEPDPDADRWSAWLPPLDPTSDHTGAADPAQATPPPPQSPGPTLPQSAGPGVPPPAPAQRASSSYRSAPPPPVAPQWVGGPRSNLALSIFATFFGFTPLGIVAIFLSLSVGRLHRSGRIAEAERASRRARTWAITALVLSMLWTLLYSFVLSS